MRLASAKREPEDLHNKSRMYESTRIWRASSYLYLCTNCFECMCVLGRVANLVFGHVCLYTTLTSCPAPTPFICVELFAHTHTNEVVSCWDRCISFRGGRGISAEKRVFSKAWLWAMFFRGTWVAFGLIRSVYVTSCQ